MPSSSCVVCSSKQSGITKEQETNGLLSNLGINTNSYSSSYFILKV